MPLSGYLERMKMTREAQSAGEGLRERGAHLSPAAARPSPFDGEGLWTLMRSKCGSRPSLTKGQSGLGGLVSTWGRRAFYLVQSPRLKRQLGWLRNVAGSLKASATTPDRPARAPRPRAAP